MNRVSQRNNERVAVLEAPDEPIVRAIMNGLPIPVPPNGWSDPNLEQLADVVRELLDG